MRRSTTDHDSMTADEMAHSVAPESAVIRAALDGIVLQSLRPICAGLTALYVIFAVSHALFLPPAAAAKMSVVASATAALLLALYFVFRRYAIPASWAHAVGAGIAVLILF